MLKYLEAIEELPNELKGPLVRILELFREDIAETVKRSDFERFEKTTEENFNRVWKSIEELADAQRRTEQRVGELADVQKRTENEIRTLASELKDTKKMVGGLSHTYGYTLENSAYKGPAGITRKGFWHKSGGDAYPEIYRVS